MLKYKFCLSFTRHVHEKKCLVGPDKLHVYKQSLDGAVFSLLALISREYATACLSAPPVYIRQAQQNISGSAASELMSSSTTLPT